MAEPVFVSYSRKDARLIKPVVALLRARDSIFLDLDGIKPGKKWRMQLDEALRAAELVVLFWCRHSVRSKEVQKEYEFALSTGKNVLPVLLDSTPMPESLREFQWVDFRELARSRHRSVRRWLTLGTLISIGALMALFTLHNSTPVDIRPPSFPQGGPVVLPAPAPVSHLPLIIAFLVIVGCPLDRFPT